MKRWKAGLRFSSDKSYVAAGSFDGGFRSETAPYCGKRNESAESIPRQ